MNDQTKKRILIIEDNEAFLRIMKLRLESTGYEVLTAIDGLAGLNTAKEEVPDLIISDLMLPKMDGHKICRLLKFDNNLKHIPIIMLTSRDLDEDENIAKKCGANAFIIKTTHAEIILDVIKKLLKKNAVIDQ